MTHRRTVYSAHAATTSPRTAALIPTRRPLAGLFAVALVIVCAGCASLPTPESRKAMQLVRTGSELLTRGHRADAVLAFDEAASVAPKDFATLVSIVAALQSSGMDAESIRFIFQALALRAESDELDRVRDSRLYTMLGDTYWASGLYHLAEPAYRQAIELDDRNALALNNLGYYLADARLDPREALRLTRKAVEIDPHNGSYQDSLGWTYFRLGRHRIAARILRRAVELSPSEPEVRFHLGSAYEKCGNRPAAQVEFVKARILNPSIFRSHGREKPDLSRT